MKLIPLMFAVVSTFSTPAMAHMLSNQSIFYQVCGAEAHELALKMGKKSPLMQDGKQFFRAISDFDLMKHDVNLYGHDFLTHNTYRSVILDAFFQGHKIQQVAPVIEMMEQSGMVVYFHKNDGCFRIVTGAVVRKHEFKQKTFKQDTDKLKTVDLYFNQYKSNHDVSELRVDREFEDSMKSHFKEGDEPPALPETAPGQLSAPDSLKTVPMQSDTSKSAH